MTSFINATSAEIHILIYLKNIPVFTVLHLTANHGSGGGLSQYACHAGASRN